MYTSLRANFQEVHKMHAPSQEHEQICFYPAISTFAVQIYYTNTFLLYSY